MNSSGTDPFTHAAISHTPSLRGHIGPQTDFGRRETRPTECREAHPRTPSRPTGLKTNDRDGIQNQTVSAADQRRALTARHATAEGAAPPPGHQCIGLPRPARQPLHHRSALAFPPLPPCPSSGSHTPPLRPHHRNLMRRAHAAGPLGERHATPRRRSAGALCGPSPRRSTRRARPGTVSSTTGGVECCHEASRSTPTMTHQLASRQVEGEAATNRPASLVHAVVRCRSGGSAAGFCQRLCQTHWQNQAGTSGPTGTGPRQ
jgi:hypothetical protein